MIKVGTTLGIIIALVIVWEVHAAKVLWLLEGDGKNAFEQGLSTMRQRLAAEEEDTREILWEVLHVYTDSQQVTYDDKKFKLYVVMQARAEEKYNTNQNCSALISKAKKVVFGGAVKENLLKTFPGVLLEDLRYFIHFRGYVDTLVVKEAESGEIETVEPDEPYDFNAVSIVKSTYCRNSVLSDDVLF